MSAQYQTHVLQDWVQYKGFQNSFFEIAPVIDSNNNSYIAGATLNDDGDYDAVVTKYDKYGVEQWSDIISGQNQLDDFASSIVLDSNGLPIVTGSVGSLANGYRIYVRKYSATGTVLFNTIYDLPNSPYEIASSIVLDAQDNIYIGGASIQLTEYDFLVAKFNSSGTFVWVNTRDVYSQNDAVVKVELSGSNLVALGAVEYTADKYQMASMSFNKTTGSFLNSFYTGGDATTFEKVTDGLVTATDEIYLCGSIKFTGGDEDLKIIKLDDDLDELWTVIYNTPYDGEESAEGIAEDSQGNIIVTGYKTSAAGDEEVLLMKVSPSGTILWNIDWAGDALGDDRGSAVYVDASDDIILSGYTQNKSNRDIITKKYSSSGNPIWSIDYNGLANGDDRAMNLTQDDDGNILVVGQTDSFIEGKSQYVTIYYNEKDLIIPDDVEDIPAHMDFRPNLGQLMDQDGDDITDDMIYNWSSYPATFASENMLAMEFVLPGDSDMVVKRVNLNFNPANLNPPKVRAIEKKDLRSSYMLPHITNDQRAGVPHYDKAVLPGIWSDVDMVYSNNAEGIVVQYVCHPGFDSGKLAFSVDGHSGLSLDANGDLLIYYGLGTQKINRPTAYQLDSGGNPSTLTWSGTYSIVGNSVSLSLGSFNTSQPLVLTSYEPEVVPSGTVNNNIRWSTLMGHTGLDEVDDITADQASGKFWTLGRTTSEFLVDNAGVVYNFLVLQGDLECDMCPNAHVVSFDAEHHLDWHCFFGSSADDYVAELDHDANGNIYAVGTTSSSDFPNTIPTGLNYAFQGSNNSGWIVKLRDDGEAFLFDSFFGGEISALVDIASKKDVNGAIEDIYFIGSGGTGLQFTPSAGGFNEDFSGSNYFIARLDASDQLVWCSRFGGFNCILADVEVRANGNPVIAGHRKITVGFVENNCSPTGNSNFPLCDQGAGADVFSSFGGASDMILIEFNTANQLIWSTHIGTDGQESHGRDIIAIAGDETNGIVYQVFRANADNAPTSMPSTQSGAYNIDIPAGPSAILAKWNSNRQLQWYTDLGLDDFEVHGITLGSGFNYELFLAGEATPSGTASTNCGIPTSNQTPICEQPGAYTEAPSSSSPDQMFVMGFNAQDGIIWSTPYGFNYGDRFTDIEYMNGDLLLSGIQEATVFAPIEDYIPGIETDYLQVSNPNASLNGVMVRTGTNNSPSGIFSNGVIGSSAFELFPNPTAGDLHITGPFEVGSHYEVSVFDGLGRLVLRTKESPQNEGVFLQLTDNLSEGIYQLRISKEGKIIAQKSFAKE